MGRRKIEIRPIQNERNRSVTFLKRKNGLFKKAYELGVLCTVDVAVIIFEGKPGHPLKLYQYGSSDINNIVERHLRHDGEKDTRGPADFVQSLAGMKTEDVDVDAGEDDDGEEETDDLAMPTLRGAPKWHDEGLALAPDHPSQRSRPFPPDPSLSIVHRQQSLPDQYLQYPRQRQYEQEPHPNPMSNPFSSSNKRQRLDSESPVSAGLGTFDAAPAQTPGQAASYARPSQRHHQSAHQPSGPYEQYSSLAPDSAPAVSGSSFRPVHGQSHAPPPPSRTRSMSSGTSAPPIPHRTIYTDTRVGSSISTVGSNQLVVFGGRGDEGRLRGTSTSSTAGNLQLDWPSPRERSQQNPTADPERTMQRNRGRGRPSEGEQTAPGSAGGGDTGADWLDFLSGTGSGTTGVGSGAANMNTNTSAGNIPSSTESGSWERGGFSRGSDGGGRAMGRGVGGSDGMAIDGLLFGLHGGVPKKEGE